MPFLPAVILVHVKCMQGSTSLLLALHGSDFGLLLSGCMKALVERCPLVQWWALCGLNPWGGHSKVLSPVMANNDALAKHSPVSSRKYTAELRVLIKESECFRITAKDDRFFGVFGTPFSVSVNTLPASFQMGGACRYPHQCALSTSSRLGRHLWATTFKDEAQEE